jgi:acyl carrier protein
MDDSGTSGVMSVLLQVVEENAGIRLQAGDSDASFFELGLDSLFLTQFSVSLAKRFGVSLTFRQLSSEFGNLRKLARFLEDSLSGQDPPSVAEGRLTRVEPAEPVREVPRRPPAHDRAGGPPLDSEPLIQLFLRQIDVMQQQLASLSTTIGLAPADQAGGICTLCRTAEQQRRHDARGHVAGDIPVIGDRNRVAAGGRGAACIQGNIGVHANVGSRGLGCCAAEADRRKPRRAREAGVGKVLDAARPPFPGARLGRDPTGQPAWFVPRADQPGKFVKLD